MELTNAVWIDRFDHLAAAERVSACRLDRSDVYLLRRSRELQENARRSPSPLKGMLTQPSEFPDNTSAGHRTRIVSNTVDPARPVSVADVILSLDQLTSTRAEAHLSSFGNGTIH